MEIDTQNRFLVSINGDAIVLLNPPSAPMSKADALNLAAWLVALADDSGSDGASCFDDVLNAVLGS